MLTIEVFTCSGRIRLVSNYKDCEQRSSTVSKKAPTVSKKASPALKWGLRPLPATRAHFLWPFGPFCKGNFRRKNDDACGQLWTIEDKYPKPPFESPPLDFPDEDPI